MARWRLFSRLKLKEEEKTKPQQSKDEDIKDSQKSNDKDENIQDDEVILAEYKETLYTSSHASKKQKRHVLSDQRIWRDMDSIEKNIDSLEVKKTVKPVVELDKKVDRILTKNIESHPQKKPSNIIYVVSKPQPGQVKGDWAVRGHGKIYSHHRKKESAIEQARKIAKEKDATVLIQNTDGTFSKGFKPKQKK